MVQTFHNDGEGKSEKFQDSYHKELNTQIFLLKIMSQYFSNSLENNPKKITLRKKQRNY